MLDFYTSFANSFSRNLILTCNLRKRVRPPHRTRAFQPLMVPALVPEAAGSLLS